MVNARLAGSLLTGALLALAGVTGRLPAQGATPPTNWPLVLHAGGGTTVIYQPQIRAWQRDGHISGIAAVGVTLPGAAAPTYGTLSFAALTSADVPAGMLTLVDPRPAASNWPGAAPAAAAQLDRYLRTNAKLVGAAVPLATVFASLPPGSLPSTIPPRATPPIIAVSQRKAVLVVFAGTPVMQPIAGTALTHATNADATVIGDASGVYVLTADGWMTTASLNDPAWVPVAAPASFAALPAAPPWLDVRARLNAPPSTDPPHVFVTTQPAVLIRLDGPPQFANVPGTQLRYVANTKSDLFFSRATTLWYVLIDGRWFSAANLNGPWTFASANLPSDFKKIPADGPRGRVLSAVPGTTQAFYASRASQLARVTPVDPAKLTLTVSYAGAPAFAPLAGTTLLYATNTATPVFQVGAQYFACNEGVWFTAGAAAGPWTAATYVPAVIYTIPPSSPLYRVTFVHVYDAAGRPQTAPQTAAAPAPQPTYQTFGAGQATAGTRAAYYNAAVAPYYGGNWAPFPVTNYNDSQFAQQEALAQNGAQFAPTTELPPTTVPGSGPRLPVNPNNNVFATDDGAVYRYAQESWARWSGQAWVLVYGIPPALAHDARARRDGYRGTPS